MTTETLNFEPQPGPQTEFLATEADIAVYGGAAGGGKSWALTYDPIRHIGVKGFAGIIFRRTTPEITNAGGLWDQAGELYPAAGGKGIRGTLDYRFSSKARISFRQLEDPDTVLAYQGSQICYLAFDELTHFTESQFFYMLSRNRSKCGIRPYVRATCNPDPGWVKTKLLAPWVDEDFKGERAKPGEIRWFKRVDGKIKWLNEWTARAKSVTFIPASVFDNKILLEANPEYVDNLEALPTVEQERLLRGNWRIRREGLVYPLFEQCVVDDTPHAGVYPTHGGMDFGFRNPFAAVWGHFDCDDVLWITGCRWKSQTGLSIHSEHLPRGVEWWCDPAEPGSAQELRVAGHSIRPCVHIPSRGATGEKRNPKMSGIAQVSRRMETGRLKIVRCDETMPLLRELGLYRYDPEKSTEEPIDVDNHSPDALRYLIAAYDRGRFVSDRESDESRSAREAIERAATERIEQAEAIKWQEERERRQKWRESPAGWSDPSWGWQSLDDSDPYDDD